MELPRTILCVTHWYFDSCSNHILPFHFYTGNRQFWQFCSEVTVHKLRRWVYSRPLMEARQKQNKHLNMRQIRNSAKTPSKVVHAEDFKVSSHTTEIKFKMIKMLKAKTGSQNHQLYFTGQWCIGMVQCSGVQCLAQLMTFSFDSRELAIGGFSFVPIYDFNMEWCAYSPSSYIIKRAAFQLHLP